VLKRSPCAVKAPAVDLQRHALLAPQEVDLVAVGACVDGRRREPGLAYQGEEVLLGVGARARGRSLIGEDRRQRSGAAAPDRSRRDVLELGGGDDAVTSASWTARSSARGLSDPARSSRVRAGEVTGRPRWTRMSRGSRVLVRCTITPRGEAV
jgi:hypothetical protein